MNENLDLCKILEGCEGMKLWSPLCGDCTLSAINIASDYQISVRFNGAEDCDDFFAFDSMGKYYSGAKYGECVIFPSKDQRDWSKFVKPIKEGTPMMCRLRGGDWILRYYAGIIDGKHKVYQNNKTIAGGFQNGMIPFDKFDPNNIDESLKYDIQK